jgi:hypothetical protein
VHVGRLLHSSLQRLRAFIESDDIPD